MSNDQTDFEARFNNWLALEKACRDDVMEILDFLDTNDSNQALRRAFIRASWGYIEAVAAGHHDLADFANEHEPENYASINHRERTCERVKKVLKAVCKMMCPGWSPDFSGEGWKCFLDSNKKRNSLMHPKKPRDLAITDTDLNIAKCAISWLIETTNEIKLRSMARVGNPLP